MLLPLEGGTVTSQKKKGGKVGERDMYGTDPDVVPRKVSGSRRQRRAVSD